jgi:phage/plasmid-like protein (TIGR03299 family)
VIQDDLTAIESAQRFGLLWPVNQFPLYAQDPTSGEYLPVDSHVANMRVADNDGRDIRELLGIVGADYKVCQNRELAEFTDALAQTRKVVIESCGSIRGGKRVWFLAKGDGFMVGGTDAVLPYVLVSNGHDGSQAIRVTPTTVRVVCSNTLHMVLPNSDDWQTRPESAAIVIRHSGKILDKLEQAKKALEYYGATLARNVELFQLLQSKRMERDTAMSVFAETYATYWEAATPDDLASGDAATKRNAENRQTRMRKAADLFLARYEAEQSALGLGETPWAYFNALTGFLQHDKGARGADDAKRVEARRESNLFGLNATRTHEALAAILAVA